MQLRQLLFLLGAIALCHLPDAAGAQQRQAFPVKARDSVARGCPTCIEKRVDLAVVEVVFLNMLAISLNRFYYGEGVSPDTWQANLDQGFEFDQNKFRANYIEHPLAGSLFYNLGRSNAMGFWESAPLAFGGSLMFEYFGEPTPPSINDLATTTLGGIPLGESLYRLSSIVLDNRDTGASRVLREVAGALMNPGRGFNRLVQGRMWTVGPNHFERVPRFIDARLDTGARRVAEGPSLSTGVTDGALRFRVIYGDPVEEALRTPFQAFRFSAQLGSGGSQSLDGLFVEGNLYGTDTWATLGGRHKLIVTMEFDYNDNAAYLYGQNSFNAGLLSRWPVAQSWAIRTNAAVEAIPFGAVSNGVTGGRGYDFAAGAGMRLVAGLLHRRRPLLELGYQVAWLHTMNGANSGATVEFITARIDLPLVGRLGVGADGLLFTRSSWHGETPFSDQRSPELQIFASWRLH